MKKESTQEEVTKSPDKKDYVEVRLPKLSFRNVPINVYLVLALVVFAFLLGMLTNKVMTLEKTLTAVPTTAEQAAVPSEPELPQVVDVENGKLPMMGNKDAKVTIVEFSDFQCPFCKRFIDETYVQIKKEYIDTGKVNFYYRHYPLSSIHPNAEKAAEASECANDQDKFWAYHDELFAQQDTWSPLTGEPFLASLTDMAGQLGVDTTQFRSCLDSGKYTQKVADDTAAATEAQVNATPSFFINGYRVVGAQPFSEIQKIIEQELKK